MLSFDINQVFISLLLQISIAIIACLTLAGLEFWPSNKEKRERYHSHALATALVEFHKNQCFSSLRSRSLLGHLEDKLQSLRQ